MYGVILEPDRVPDVDIRIFLDETVIAQQSDMVDALSVKLSAALRVPVGRQVFNDAPPLP